MHRISSCCLLSAVIATVLACCSGTTATARMPPSLYDRSNAAGNQFLLRPKPAKLDELLTRYELTVIDEIGNSGELFLVQGPSSIDAQQLEQLAANDPAVVHFERAGRATLPEIDAAALILTLDSDILPDLLRNDELSTPCLSEHIAPSLWAGYAAQQAVDLIGLHEAHLASQDCGDAVVAVLDTGIDPDHPLLAGALVPGYDFLLDIPGMPSEWSMIEQSVRAIVEQSVRAIVEQSNTAAAAGAGSAFVLDTPIGPVLEQSVRAIVEEQALPSAFGHGTMVAGLIRLGAPAAKIMPLRVFDASGSGHVFDIVRAIYYAVDHGANIINMSFSMPVLSKELREAVKYARNHGVVCIAAAGNQGEHTLVYPAALNASLGIASTTLSDELSDFSNRGAQLVDLAAPGHGLISLFPGGLYAAGWGTSFSTPLVAAAAALVHTSAPAPTTAAAQHKKNILQQSSLQLTELTGDVQSGRLDVLGAVLLAAGDD